jgi:hypothetical protein
MGRNSESSFERMVAEAGQSNLTLAEAENQVARFAQDIASEIGFPASLKNEVYYGEHTGAPSRLIQVLLPVRGARLKLIFEVMVERNVNPWSVYFNVYEPWGKLGQSSSRKEEEEMERHGLRGSNFGRRNKVKTFVMNAWNNVSSRTEEVAALAVSASRDVE